MAAPAICTSPPEHEAQSNCLRLVIFDNGGLTDQYGQCDTLDCSQWTTDTIGGCPVIRATDGLISKYGSCKLLLGIADDATVAIVDVEIDPCGGRSGLRPCGAGGGHGARDTEVTRDRWVRNDRGR